MKRLSVILAIIMAVSLVSALPAEARHQHHRPYRCFHHTFRRYPGSTADHSRIGEVDVRATVCARKSHVRDPGRIIRRRTVYRVDGWLNGLGRSTGYKMWYHPKYRLNIGSSRFQEHVGRWFQIQQCLIADPFCMGTMDWVLSFQFNSPYLIHHSDGSLQRWVFKSYCGPPGGECTSRDSKLTWFLSP